MQLSAAPKKKGKSRSGTNKPQAQVPNPAILREYSEVAPELPALIIQAWERRHHRQFVYATTLGVIGGCVMLTLIGGYIYLVMEDHRYYAAGLLSGGVLSAVAGFIATRLDS